jgi:hypothetical protein
MGNPLPADIYTIYTESNGLQKLLTYFLDSLPSSLNGITHKKSFFSFPVFIKDRHESVFLLSHVFRE